MPIPSDGDLIERVVKKFLGTHADNYQTTAQATRQCGLLEGDFDADPHTDTRRANAHKDRLLTGAVSALHGVLSTAATMRLGVALCQRQWAIDYRSIDTATDGKAPIA